MGLSPSQLVEQRPDVRQAEENLHSASAQIGIAIANRFPSFALTGTLGVRRWSSHVYSRQAPGFWDVGASVTQPIFKVERSCIESVPRKLPIPKLPNNIAALY